MLGEDPREYTWSDFLRWCAYATEEQGSELYRATLTDQDFVEQLYQQALAEQSSKIIKKGPDEDRHPSLRGYTRTVEKLDDLTDNVIALRAESGNWRPSSVRYTDRPLFPMQAAQDRLAKRARSRRDAAILAAQNRYKERHVDRKS